MEKSNHRETFRARLGKCTRLNAEVREVFEEAQYTASITILGRRPSKHSNVPIRERYLRAIVEPETMSTNVQITVAEGRRR